MKLEERNVMAGQKVFVDYFSALCSSYAYQNESTIREILKGYNSPMQFDKFFQDKSTSTEAFIAINHDESKVILAFRGSQELRNYKTCTTFKLVPFTGGQGKVLSGFLKAWNSVKDSILLRLGQIITNPSKYTLVITGHSLGGALATIASVDIFNYFKNKYQKVPGNFIMVNFGAPMVGNKDFANMYNGLTNSGLSSKLYLDPNEPNWLNFAFSKVGCVDVTGRTLTENTNNHSILTHLKPISNYLKYHSILNYISQFQDPSFNMIELPQLGEIIERLVVVTFSSMFTWTSTNDKLILNIGDNDKRLNNFQFPLSTSINNKNPFSKTDCFIFNFDSSSKLRIDDFRRCSIHRIPNDSWLSFCGGGLQGIQLIANGKTIFYNSNILSEQDNITPCLQIFVPFPDIS